MQQRALLQHLALLLRESEPKIPWWVPILPAASPKDKHQAAAGVGALG